MSEPTMAGATTSYSLKEGAVPSPQAWLNSHEEVGSDNTEEREFCTISAKEGAKDFAFGVALPLTLPKEVATKRDWRGATKAASPLFYHLIVLPANIVSALSGHGIDYNMLLKTPNGTGIPGEVVLNIIEKTIDLEPTSVLNLSLVSKGFKVLIDTFEKSIVRALIHNHDGKLTYANSLQSPVLGTATLSSYVTINDTTSYKWYSEMRARAVIVETLAHHKIMDMDLDAGNNWPTLDIDKSELYNREIVLKKNGLLLLFKLSDSIVGLFGTDEVRSKQSQFLESLSETELAILISTVEILGAGFKNCLSVHANQNREPIDDYTLAERTCVFQDKVQRFGPYFACAYLYGTMNEERRPDLWVWEEVEQGIEDLRSFELGYAMAYASLQSVGWRVFSQKMGCILEHVWVEAKKLIEVEMAGYKL